MTFAEKVLHFNASLSIDSNGLPGGIKVMNPFRDGNAEYINKLTATFYNKFYNDSKPRKLILGINPGRLGAGATGIPFTDTKRLNADCGIEATEFKTHEPSSAFIYEMIRTYGGVEKFFIEFYVGAICPLGFVKINENDKATNFNYYDRKDLQDAVLPFIIKTLKQQLDFGIDTKTCFCLGTGKNYKFLKMVNDEY